MAQEIELKLAIPEGALPLVLAHPLIVACPRQGQVETLANTYFDTPEFALRQARVAVRLRRVGERSLQTVKAAQASVDGLSTRPEWESPCESGVFDFSLVDDAGVRALLEQHAARLAPVFDTTFVRDTRLYCGDGNVRIEIMIDTGRVSAAGRESPISELELELVSGCADDLRTLAARLCATLPLRPEDVSKAARGFALLAEQHRSI